MLNLLVRHSLTAQEHDFHLQLHEGMRVVKARIAQSFNSFRAPRQFEHVKTSGSKLTMQLHFYQKFSKVSSCPARSICCRCCQALLGIFFQRSGKRLKPSRDPSAQYGTVAHCSATLPRRAPMRHRWSEDTQFTRVVLEVEDNVCAVCGGALHICDHRRHRIFTLQGPVEVVCKLAHCSDRQCAARAKTHSPYAETTLPLPWWLIGWDVFCWMGHRRFARHWSVPQSRGALADTYQIPLSADAVEDALRRYQTMLAARQQDPQVVAAAYRHVEAFVLSSDGLQPEKGHETLYVVRELNAKRIGFAEALLSSSADEVRRLLIQARAWATQLRSE